MALLAVAIYLVDDEAALVNAMADHYGLPRRAFLVEALKSGLAHARDGMMREKAAGGPQLYGLSSWPEPHWNPAAFGFDPNEGIGKMWEPKDGEDDIPF